MQLESHTHTHTHIKRTLLWLPWHHSLLILFFLKSNRLNIPRRSFQADALLSVSIEFPVSGLKEVKSQPAQWKKQNELKFNNEAKQSVNAGRSLPHLSSTFRMSPICCGWSIS